MVARRMVGLASARGAIVCVILNAAFAAHAQTPPPSIAAERPAAASGPEAPKPPIDLNSDIPPPTSYDGHVDNDSVHLVAPDGRSLTEQLVRSVLALGFVLALIYLLAKIVLPRFYRGLPRSSGGQLKVVERLALDNKHSVMVLEVGDGMRLLVGAGEGGVQLLTELPPLTSSFQNSMSVARSDAGGPDTGGKRGGDAKTN